MENKRRNPKMKRINSIDAKTLEAVYTHTNNLVKDKIKNIGANSIFLLRYLQNAGIKTRR